MLGTDLDAEGIDIPWVWALPTFPLSSPLKRYKRDRKGRRNISSFRFKALLNAFSSGVPGKYPGGMSTLSLGSVARRVLIDFSKRNVSFG
jgi:hypothetical protein